MPKVTLELELSDCIRTTENHGGYRAGECISCGESGWIDKIEHKPDCPVGKAATQLTEGEVAILVDMCKQFLQPEFSDHQKWVEIDGNQGITFVPYRHVFDARIHKVNDPQPEHAKVFYSGTIDTVSLREGVGTRLSASGYMDCTDWTVYDNLVEAQRGIIETYGDG